MRRWLATGAALVAGAMLGGVLALNFQGASSMESEVPPPTVKAAPATPLTTAPAPEEPPTTHASATPTVSPPPSDEVLVAWTPGGLPEGFTAKVADLAGVTAVAAVRSDIIHLVESRDAEGRVVDRPGSGFVIPLEAMAFDPSTYGSFLPKEQLDRFGRLGPGQAILSATSARQRRLGPGGTLELEDGSRLTVVDVVEDALVGGTEVALSLPGAKSSGLATERYVLIRHGVGRKGMEQAIRELLPPGLAVRIRGPGETPVLRHGDAVLPQAAIKERFGEFAYRPGGGIQFDVNSAWVEANIVTEKVPLLGTITCHRSLLGALRGALQELERRNLGFLIDPDGFRGCWNPRYISAGKGISRHTWGAAVDLNITANPQGLESVQDPRLVRVMETWGFTSGKDWLIPDPGHFEYIRPPAVEASG